MGKSFITSGAYTITITALVNKELKVTETDNGLYWIIDFEIDDIHLDRIDMEHIKPTKLHDSVKDLKVFDTDGNYLGTVQDRLDYALEYLYT